MSPVDKIVWEKTAKQNVDKSILNCAFRCERLGSCSCTGFLFDEKTKMCSLGKAETIPLPLQPENTGLKVAWSSSTSYLNNMFPWYCVDGNTRGSLELENLCFVRGGNLPWLAVDMVHTQAVSSITFVNRKDDFWENMGNVEVRLGVGGYYKLAL